MSSSYGAQGWDSNSTAQRYSCSKDAGCAVGWLATWDVERAMCFKFDNTSYQLIWGAPWTPFEVHNFFTYVFVVDTQVADSQKVLLVSSGLTESVRQIVIINI